MAKRAIESCRLAKRHGVNDDMKKVNTSEVEEQEFESPKGVYAMRDINLSHALGRKAESTGVILSTSRSAESRQARKCARTIRTARSGNFTT